MDRQTWWWWTGLRATSVANLVALGVTVAASPAAPHHALQLACAAVYAAVCAFRSFFPRVDLERTVLVDHPLSSIALGRTSATVAELAFTVQCASFAAGLAPLTDPRLATAAWGLVPLIAVAQVFCWLGVLTLRHVWHAAEEACWVVMMAVLAAVFVEAFPGAEGALRWALAVGLVGCAGGAYVMAVLDIPMYLRRWREDRGAGLSIGAGLVDAARRREPTGAWEVWRHEVGWMTPYFTAGVWLSLALAWLPGPS